MAPFALGMQQCGGRELEKAAEQLMWALSCALTTAEAIRRILEIDAGTVDAPNHAPANLVVQALKELQDELPQAMKAAHAEWISLVFDGFPKPCPQLETEETNPEYFRRRAVTEVMETEAAFLSKPDELPKKRNRGHSIPRVAQHLLVVNWN
jgi:hypothetical protein